MGYLIPVPRLTPNLPKFPFPQRPYVVLRGDRINGGHGHSRRGHTSAQWSQGAGSSAEPLGHITNQRSCQIPVMMLFSSIRPRSTLLVSGLGRRVGPCDPSSRVTMAR
jgi:hypothetical protein